VRSTTDDADSRAEHEHDEVDQPGQELRPSPGLDVQDAVAERCEPLGGSRPEDPLRLDVGDLPPGERPAWPRDGHGSFSYGVDLWPVYQHVTVLMPMYQVHDQLVRDLITKAVQAGG
jgi:hypothetical protein